MYPITLTIVRPCEDESKIEIPIGTKVEYIAHLPGGMIQVKWNNKTHVIHPHATDKLGPEPR